MLVDYGFRLKSALDNRPLKLEEFEKLTNQIIYMSATPGDYEKKQTDHIVQQIIRPTGLLDPEIEVRPIMGQMDDLVGEINKRTEKNERVFVTTLTKKMAEDLTDYLKELGIKVKYLHSDIKTLERTRIVRICVLANLTFWSESICFAKESTFLKSRWWQFLMPTRKDSLEMSVP